MTRGLGAWGPDEEAVVEDAVPQDLDGLGLWAVRDAVLGRVLAGRDPDELVGAGLLPFGMPGRALLADARREVAAILGDAPPPAPPVAVSVELEGFAVRGHASDAMVHAGSLSAAHRFAGWITHVARAAAGHDTPTTVRARKGAVTYAPVSRLLALDVLGNLVQLYRYGRRLPLLWFPETTWGIACKWRSLPWGGLRDREPDPWTRRVLGGRNPFDDDLTDVVPVPRGCSARELGETLWRPARAAEVRR